MYYIPNDEYRKMHDVYCSLPRSLRKQILGLMCLLFSQKPKMEKVASSQRSNLRFIK